MYLAFLAIPIVAFQFLIDGIVVLFKITMWGIFVIVFILLLVKFVKLLTKVISDSWLGLEVKRLFQ